MQTYSKIVFIVFLIFHFTTNSFSESQDPVRGKNGMVVSASELASKVGVEILKKGGNAVDAAVAVGFALAVTHPSAGNIGGGGFMVIHLNNGTNTTIDYREKAPASANEFIFQDSLGNFLPDKSQSGVTSSGVPGSVAGLIYALEKYGSLSLAEVLQPAIDLARNGFELQYRLAKSLAYELEYFNQYESSKKVFTKDGIPFNEGELLIQKDLANTLELIKQRGAAGFYSGKTAELIVNQIKQLGGFITLDDLSNYKPVERIPITTDYRGYKVITMGPPSGGGVTLLQMLNILENYSFTKEEWGSSNYIHKLVETMKYSFADRSKHIGDPDFYNVPIEWLLSKKYAKEIFNKITDVAVPSSEILPGVANSYLESEETTHYSVVDKFGNSVSTTTTINSSYGSKIVVEGAGFLLNNEMDDFSSKPGEPNQFGLIGSEANKIEPNKRMQSSMSPTIILKDDKTFMLIGSPGGSTISTIVLQVILNVLDFNMDIQKAIDMPHIHHQWLPDVINYERFGLSLDVIQSLKNKGQVLGGIRSLGRCEGIVVDSENKIIFGATDPRGYGAAVGY
ncbi:MAG: gamma-glutamyltransferase [Ignavibacteriaceae bacterium]|nr:gamma-glutamyltransferase [Ignavibacterium sp.]MCC6256335.1 gamma-glutamyltransferase [Ignavibacteriaceae bacterium]HRN25106.1 gamma-glutamyltransferase [Ignavibacteriaceae bacterium]